MIEDYLQKIFLQKYLCMNYLEFKENICTIYKVGIM